MNMSDCQVPNSTLPSTTGRVLFGGRSTDLRCACALEGWLYSLCFGTSSSMNFLMSLSSAGSFSVRISMPVACGAKTWTIPFRIPDLATASCSWVDKSTNSISPPVENITWVLAILKEDMPFTRYIWVECGKGFLTVNNRSLTEEGLHVCLEKTIAPSIYRKLISSQ